jgi:hypothetical protein
VNQRFEAGQFITFTYNPPARDVRRRAGLQAVEIHDRNKSVLVLNPNWNHEMHGIDLKRITPAEVQTLKAVMDPKVKAAVDRGEWPVEGAPPYPLVRDILNRMDPAEVIKNPIMAYQMLVKPFLRNKDAYRRYKTQYVFGVRVVVESHVEGQVTNPRPMFGEPLFKKI